MTRKFIYSCVNYVSSYSQEKLVKPREKEKEKEKSPEVWTDSENARSKLEFSLEYIYKYISTLDNCACS